MPSEIRTEIRRNPRNGDLTIHLIGLRGPLIDSQIGTEGKEIDIFPKMPSDNGIQVQVISPPVPLLTLEAEPVGGIDGTAWFYDREPSFGADERLNPNKINSAGLEMILRGFKYRTRELRHDDRFQGNLRLFYPYVVYQPGDKSDEKLIGRMLAARVIAPAIREEVRYAKEYSDFRKGAPNYQRCIDCDIVREEIKKAGVKKSRVIVLTEHFLGIVPFSSSRVYSAHFIPRRHVARFSELTQQEIGDLAIPLYSEVQKISRVASKNVRFDAVNISFHSLPFYSTREIAGVNGIGEAYHMYVEVSPAMLPINRKENYEIPGSRIYVSKVRPKDTGGELRI